MRANEDFRGKLRGLRDRLAVEAPRARVRPNTNELAKRLQAALDRVNRVYLASAARSAGVNTADAWEDVVAEAHLVLHDWERITVRRAR